VSFVREELDIFKENTKIEVSDELRTVYNIVDKSNSEKSYFFIPSQMVISFKTITNRVGELELDEDVLELYAKTDSNKRNLYFIVAFMNILSERGCLGSKEFNNLQDDFDACDAIDKTAPEYQTLSEDESADVVEESTIVDNIYDEFPTQEGLA